MLEEEDKGIRRVNRPMWEGGSIRYVTKLMKNKNWFKINSKEEQKRGRKGEYRGDKDSKEESREKVKREEDEPETVMFVPYTDNSKLQKMLQEKDNEFIRGGSQKRIKFVERGGQSLVQILGRSNPWQGRGCNRGECFQCQHGGGGGRQLPAGERVIPDLLSDV